MEKVLLKDIPRKCNHCEVYVFTEAPRPQMGMSAWVIAGVGVLATLAWIIFMAEQAQEEGISPSSGILGGSSGS